MIGIFKLVSAAPPLRLDEAWATYTRLRVQVFGGIFVGYAGCYPLGKFFSLAIPDLIEAGYTRTEPGCALVWWMENREGPAARPEGEALE